MTPINLAFTIAACLGLAAIFILMIITRRQR